MTHPPAARTPIRRVALLVNPGSGHGVGGRTAEEAVAEFGRRGVAVDLLTGTSAAESRRLAAGALGSGADALVICGGDGLLAVALQEIAGTGLPIGLVPAGTGNDLARDLGIAGAGTARAVDVVAGGQVETADLGRVTTDDGVATWFATVACAGFDSAANAVVNSLRWPHGSARYVLGAALAFPRHRPRPYRFTFDSGEVVETEVFLSAYGITRSYGGGMCICPDADRTDGLLDLTWVEGNSKLTALLQFGRVFSGTHVGRPGVVTRRCRSVRVEAGGVRAFADGDDVAPLPVTIEAVPGVARYLVP